MATLIETARRARTGRVGPAEERLFRLIDDGPDGAHPAVWPIMQSGSLAAVFVSSARHRRRGDRQAALVSLITGTAVWAGAKVAKRAVGRGRPTEHLVGVTVRGRPQSGLGYPSGHAAVSVALALIDTRDLGRAGRVASLAVAGAAGAGRIYVGAHLPLDVAGGASIGVLGGRLAIAFLRRGDPTRAAP